MQELLLQYRGKRKPFTTPPIFKTPFTFNDDPVWIPLTVAEQLIELNPCMFHKLDRRDLENPIVEPKDIKPKKELEVPDVTEKEEEKDNTDYEFYCDKCGKGYNAKWAYDRHIARCDGNDE